MVRFLLPALTLLAAGCTRPAIDMMQAPAAALRAPAYVSAVVLSLGPEAKKEVAVSDAKVMAKAAAGYAGMAFAALLPRMFKDSAAARGLTAGRALTVVVELDHLRVPGAGGALAGRHDRLAGLVRVTDARTGEVLATFYVDVDQHYPGLIGLAVREGNGGVRERLASAFVRHVLDQIAPPAAR
jgi:hypothetical protein